VTEKLGYRLVTSRGFQDKALPLGTKSCGEPDRSCSSHRVVLSHGEPALGESSRDGL